PGGLRDPGFERLLSRIDGGGAVHRGNDLWLYCDGEETMQAMIDEVGRAEREVLVEAYIFTDDETGRRFFAALRDARRRGVEVKVLADAFGSFRTREAFWREMRDEGIEVRLFHRLFPRLWWHPFRDHRKVLAVDRRVAFTGGMNIANEYAHFTRSGRKLPLNAMRDTHIRIEGPAAWEMVAVFAEGWERAEGTPLPLVDPPAGPPADGEREGARVLVLESRPGRGHRETAAALSAIVAAARETVWITNGYFAPGRQAVAILGHAARRGLDVRLLLPGRTDVPLVRHAGHGWYSRLLRKGVRIWEYQAAVLHAKTVVADRYVSVVGSTNLDFRSFRFNSECNAVVLDDRLGQTLASTFEGDVAQSEEMLLLPWRRRGVLHKAGDRLAGTLTPLL
ncbi:MAG TPA: phospholipase D-like domain-containing protein, partial [Thermoanaerobaculia bacterium]|nr:phospholipase D-like domain-containing protein [Thermoanaerobaculia bacterium]